jgi:hypothetical protein
VLVKISNPKTREKYYCKYCPATFTKQEVDDHHPINRVVRRLYKLKRTKFAGFVIHKPIRHHTAWHSLFANATPLEAIQMLRQGLISKTKWAFIVLFGQDASMEDAVIMIEQEWVGDDVVTLIHFCVQVYYATHKIDSYRMPLAA